MARCILLPISCFWESDHLFQYWVLKFCRTSCCNLWYYFQEVLLVIAHYLWVEPFIFLLRHLWTIDIIYIPSYHLERVDRSLVEGVTTVETELGASMDISMLVSFVWNFLLNVGMTPENIFHFLLYFKCLRVVNFKYFFLLILGNILGLSQWVLLKARDCRLKWLISHIKVVIITGSVGIHYLNFLHCAWGLGDQVLHALVEMVLDRNRHLLFELSCGRIRRAIDIALLNMKFICELLSNIWHWSSIIKLFSRSHTNLRVQLIAIKVSRGHVRASTNTLPYLCHFLRFQNIWPMSQNRVFAFVESDLLDGAAIRSDREALALFSWSVFGALSLL